MRTFKLKKCKRVSQLRFSPDVRRLVAVGASQAFIVEAAVTVDVTDSAEVGRVERTGVCGTLTPDASHFLVGGADEYGDGPPLGGLSLLEPGLAYRVAGPSGRVTAFGLGCDRTGDVVAFGYGRETRSYSIDVVESATDLVRSIAAPAPPVVLEFDDGARLAATGGPEGEPRVDVFGLPSGKLLTTLQPGGTRTTSLAFLPDGRLVAASGRNVFVYPPDFARPQFTLGNHKGQINALAVSPDGRRILSASHDGAIRVWDTGNGELVKSLDWQIGPVTAVAFAPDGLTCAAAGKGGQIVIWDV